MRQALHIFKKDVRYLRWELALLIVLMAIFVCAQAGKGGLSVLGSYRMLRETHVALLYFMVLSFWAFLCARLIQAEAIPGDRQFWITRPYQWRSLLGAKLLFMVVCVSVPLLAADALILGMQGFSVMTHTAGLLWSSLAVIAGTLLAFCAFATLSRGLSQWMLSALATAAILYVFDAVARETAWNAVQWIRDYGTVALMMIAAVAVLIAQYRTRRTALSITLMAIGFLGSTLYAHYARPSWALGLETRFSKPKADPSAVQISLRKRDFAPPLGFGATGRQQVALLGIPVQISGLGEHTDLVSDGIIVSVKNESGEIWRADGRVSEHLENRPDGYRISMQVDQSVMEKTKGRPVELGLTLYLTMVGDADSKVIQPQGPAVDVAGIGRCRDYAEERENWIICASPLRPPANLLVVNFGESSRDRFFAGTSYSPFPSGAASSLIPVDRYFHSGSQTFVPATLTSLEPLAHFRRDLKLEGVRLSDFQVF